MLKHLIIFAIFLLSFEAHATEWVKVIACEDESGILVVDQSAQNPDNIQFVIIGRDAVRYITDSIYGYTQNSEYFRVYDDGNKLVISDLSAVDSLHPANPDAFVIHLEYGYGKESLVWRGRFDDANPFGRMMSWGFYNCQYY